MSPSKGTRRRKRQVTIQLMSTVAGLTISSAVLAGALREQPTLVEGDGLQVKFKATDVDLSRYLFRTSDPPQQLLRFTLDDFR